MTNFIKVEILAVETKVAKIIEDDAPTSWVRGYIDLHEIESFYADTTEGEECVTIRFKSNNCLTVNMTISELVERKGLSYKA